MHLKIQKHLTSDEGKNKNEIGIKGIDNQYTMGLFMNQGVRDPNPNISWHPREREAPAIKPPVNLAWASLK